MADDEPAPEDADIEDRYIGFISTPEPEVTMAMSQRMPLPVPAAPGVLLWMFRCVVFRCKNRATEVEGILAVCNGQVLYISARGRVLVSSGWHGSASMRRYYMDLYIDMQGTGRAIHHRFYRTMTFCMLVGQGEDGSQYRLTEEGVGLKLKCDLYTGRH